MAADYRYLFCDALTGQLLEELPLSGVSFSQQINSVGTFTGTLAITDIPAAVNWQAATLIKRTLLVVERDEIPVWAGRVMKRRPVGTGHTAAEVTAETLEGYLAREEIQADLTYSAVDVFVIVRGILAQHEATLGGSMNLATGANVAGWTQTITYLAKDSPKIGDAINRLAEVAPGFEYTITWSRSGNTFTPALTLATPALSTTADSLLLEFPGNLAGPVDYPEDGADAPNLLTGVGADSGGTPLLARVADTTGELAAGYPVYHGQVSMKEETDLTRLTARTTTALAAKLADHVVPTVDLATPTEPGDIHLGDFPLGAAVRLRCSCPYHGTGNGGVPGLDITSRRVTGWTVKPGPPEQVTLSLGAITGRITPPLGRRDNAYYLRQLDRRLRALEST
jgi:hypothetical protein